MPDQTLDSLSLTLDSALPTIDIVERNAEDFARRAGFDEDTASNVSMVVREAAINAVKHGNKLNPFKHVHATFELTTEDLTIRIADQGPGLDPESIPDPLAPENLLRTSGRGVFLMRAIMDEVHFRQFTPGAENPGTEITLVKHRPQKENHA